MDGSTGLPDGRDALWDADAEDAEDDDTLSPDAGGRDATVCASPSDGGLPEPFLLCSGVDGSVGDVGYAPAQAHSFRISALGTMNCRTFPIELLEAASDGVLAHSPTHIFVGGYAAQWDRLELGYRNGSPSQVYATDLASTTPYVFGADGVSVELGGVPAIVNQLIPLPESSATPTPILALEAPIVLSPGETGVFSGMGELGVLNGANLQVIDLTSGSHLDLELPGGLPSPEPCASGLTQLKTIGVLERFGSGYHLVFKANANQVVRHEVATGTTTVLATFNNLGVGCGFGLAPERGAWIFTQEGPSQFEPEPLLGILGVCEASFDYPGAPPAPLLIGTEPASPTHATNCPTAVGTAEPGVLVELFETRGCKGAPVAAVEADLSGDVRLPIWVPPGSEHQWFAQSRRSDGRRSPCVLGPGFITDSVGPSFAGTSTVQVFGDGLIARWEAGTDDTTEAKDLVYDVYLRPEECTVAERIVTSAPGVNFASVRGLLPGTRYGVQVKARDRSGLVDDNMVELFARTEVLPKRSLRVGSMGFAGCRMALSPWIDSTMAPTAGSEHLFVAAQPTSMVRLDDWLPGPLPGGYEGGYRQLVQDLSNGRVYALRYDLEEIGPIAGELANQFPEQAAVVNRLVELDPTTGLPNGSQIELSAPVQLLPYAAVFSGLNRIVIFDGERLNMVDLADGVVRRMGHFAVNENTKACGSTVGHGIVEDYGGSLHLVYIDGRNHLKRFSLETGQETTISQEASLAYVCGIDLSLARSRWYAVSDGVAFDCPLDYLQPNDKPFEVGPVPDGGVASGAPCSNGSTVNCGPPGSTYTPYVDPNPPLGFFQCAGFTNTPADDVAGNWMNNCFDSRTGPLWLRVVDNASGDILAGGRLVEPSCANATPLRYRVDQNEADGFWDVGPGECLGPGGVEVYFTGAANADIRGHLGGLSELILQTYAAGSDADEAALVLSNGPGNIRALRVSLYASP